MPKNKLIFFAVCLLLAGCGGNGSKSGSGNSTAGDAQGVYQGSSSNGYSFESIVLPNDKFWALYGTTSANEFLIYGLITGQGASGSSTYTANGATDFFYTGTVDTANVSANYAAGSSLNGSFAENGTTTTFTGSALPASDFAFNTPAEISAIEGGWTGTLMGGESATVSINSLGSVSGSSSGCSFSGTVSSGLNSQLPPYGGTNYFNVTLTFGPSPCELPNQTASGIAIEYLLSNGTTHQLLAGVTVGTTTGTVFSAER